MAEARSGGQLCQASSSSHAAWTAAPVRVDAATSPRASHGHADDDRDDASVARDPRAVARQAIDVLVPGG